MVIRDLTLRSAASFGSFHLIRLLYDEYIFYLVEHRVAAATQQTPIAVMGEVSVAPSYRIIQKNNKMKVYHCLHTCTYIYLVILSQVVDIYFVNGFCYIKI